MQIGILKCTIDPLVAIIPSVAEKLIKEGFQVVVENNAGKESLYSNEDYEKSGVTVKSRDEVLRESDILVTVSGINESDIDQASEDSLIIGKFNTRSDQDLTHMLSNKPHRIFSLDLIPRSSIAQSMDVITSLASLAGYKAVISGADHFSGYLPMMTTAAGTIPPARVLILGAGVAGLQAIATARRLGSMVEAFDVRKAVKEEVESLGGRFVEVESDVDFEDKSGYAQEQTENYLEKQRELIHQHALKSDIIITTANIPGKKAPLLLEAKSVKEMQPGSVIIDMAAESGGNCELTENNKELNVNGVIIVGNSKLHNLLPKTASRLFANNLFSFIKFMKKDDSLSLDHDVYISTHLGELQQLVEN